VDPRDFFYQCWGVGDEAGLGLISGVILCGSPDSITLVPVRGGEFVLVTQWKGGTPLSLMIDLSYELADIMSLAISIC
jgi:hypothetical protein